MTIQRYVLLAGAIGPTVSGGDWVKYEDYAALEADVRALRDDNKRMRGLLKRPIAMKIRWGGMKESMCDGFSEMVAVDALTRSVARAKRVTVYYGEKRDYIADAARKEV